MPKIQKKNMSKSNRWLSSLEKRKIAARKQVHKDWEEVIVDGYPYLKPKGDFAKKTPIAMMLGSLDNFADIMADIEGM